MLVARGAVSIALEVGGDARVTLLRVRVDAAAHEASRVEAVLAEVLHDPLAAPSPVVHKDGLEGAVERRLERAVNGLRRPCLPVLVCAAVARERGAHGVSRMEACYHCMLQKERRGEGCRQGLQPVFLLRECKPRGRVVVHARRTLQVAEARQQRRLRELLVVAKIDQLQRRRVGSRIPVGDALLELCRLHLRRDKRLLGDADDMPAELGLQRRELARREVEGDQVKLRHHQARRDPAQVATSRLGVARTQRLGDLLKGRARPAVQKQQEREARQTVSRKILRALGKRDLSTNSSNKLAENLLDRIDGRLRHLFTVDEDV